MQIYNRKDRREGKQALKNNAELVLKKILWMHKMASRTFLMFYNKDHKYQFNKNTWNRTDYRNYAQQRNGRKPHCWKYISWQTRDGGKDKDKT